MNRFFRRPVWSFKLSFIKLINLLHLVLRFYSRKTLFICIALKKCENKGISSLCGTVKNIYYTNKITVIIQIVHRFSGRPVWSFKSCCINLINLHHLTLKFYPRTTKLSISVLFTREMWKWKDLLNSTKLSAQLTRKSLFEIPRLDLTYKLKSSVFCDSLRESVQCLEWLELNSDLF